ncbi:MAG: YihY/virulence factor BrkB family protein [Alphaproteobacteria bacterium]|nr:YihY/virulence factor BrkB family protein [Alphaproteobacteria bacterium]MCW5740917.1 YihY/virulence factor BrkB family protein [Alphaproteobacteria bacterium]
MLWRRTKDLFFAVCRACVDNRLLKLLLDILLATYRSFVDNRLTSMAAAIAFYTIFSLGPVLIFSVAIAEPVVGRLMAQQHILDAIATVIGAENLDILRRFADTSLFRGRGWVAAVGLALLLYSGSAVFVELDSALDHIWKPAGGWRRHPVIAELRTRLLALVMMTAIGVLFLVVLLAGLLLSAYADALKTFPMLGEWIGPAVSGALQYGAVAAFFTVIYKALPDVVVPWPYALYGAAIVAGLFALGNWAIVYYFSVTHMASAFGAAGGVAAVMVWIYYTAIIVLLGAQVSRATRDVLEARTSLPGTEE